MYNEEILKYIKDCLTQNYTKDQIEQSLVQAGWKNSQIEEAFLSVQNNVASTQTTRLQETISGDNRHISKKTNTQDAVSKSILPKMIIISAFTIVVAMVVAVTFLTENKITERTLIQTPKNSESLTFKVPVKTTQWIMRANCPVGVSGLIMIDNEQSIDCNTDIVLDKYISKTQKVGQRLLINSKFINRTYSDQTVKVLSKAFNSKGILLAEEVFSIILKAEVDTVIKNIITLARYSAEIYYQKNGKSYVGACVDIKNTQTGMDDDNTIVTDLSSVVVCKDSSTAWAMSAQLRDSPDQYYCSDSTGVIIVRSSSITVVGCEDSQLDQQVDIITPINPIVSTSTIITTGILTDTDKDGTVYVDKIGGWSMSIPSDLYHPYSTRTVGSELPGATFRCNGSSQGTNCSEGKIKITPYTTIAAGYYRTASLEWTYDKALSDLKEIVSQNSPKMGLEKDDMLVPDARVIKIENPSFQFLGDKTPYSREATYYIFYPNDYIVVTMTDDKYEPFLSSLQLIY